MTRRTAEKIKEAVGQGLGMEHETVRSHPSFGMIHAQRTGGKRFLFGSPIEHHSFVKITVYRDAKETVRLHRKWHSPGEVVAELLLSEVQWAEFLTTLNMGTGVPCTLEYTRTGRVEELPLILDETNLQQQMLEDLERTVKQNLREFEQIRELLRKQRTKGLNKKELDELATHMTRVVENAPANAAFFAESMVEHVETLVSTAKAEITAFAQNAMLQYPQLENRMPSAPALDKPKKEGK